jgi:hypothetical protein
MFIVYLARSHSRTKRIFGSCPPVLLSTCISTAPTGRISTKFDTWGGLYEKSVKKINLVTIGHFT